jgi:hypothetical protein
MGIGYSGNTVRHVFGHHLGNINNMIFIRRSGMGECRRKESRNSNERTDAETHLEKSVWSECRNKQNLTIVSLPFSHGVEGGSAIFMEDV